MPVPVSPRPIVSVFHHPSTLPPVVWDVFRRCERNSNIMYPHAVAHSRMAHDPSCPQLWMTCSTYRSSTDTYTLDFVLSCSEGPLGSYPIFIFAAAPFEVLLDHKYVYPRVRELIYALSEHVPRERIFSVFAQEPIARVFVSLWEAQTGILAYKVPYYAAKLTYCTKETFINRTATLFHDVTYVPRLAVVEDVDAVAPLCQGFASTSEPFTLDENRARKDAKYLIRRGYLWVLEARREGEPAEIASIVAASRQSDRVAGITKVYTNPRWRKKGCAERLVRWACRELLRVKECVVLYVAHDNPAAVGVYHRVGFVGLDASVQRVDGVDPWLEIGLIKTLFILGIGKGQFCHR